VIFLDLEDLLHVGDRATGGPVEVRDIGLLESAAARARRHSVRTPIRFCTKRPLRCCTRSSAITHWLMGTSALGWLRL
jgi:hypothetical protein